MFFHRNDRLSSLLSLLKVEVLVTVRCKEISVSRDYFYQALEAKRREILERCLSVEGALYFKVSTNRC